MKSVLIITKISVYQPIFQGSQQCLITSSDSSLLMMTTCAFLFLMFNSIYSFSFLNGLIVQLFATKVFENCCVWKLLLVCWELGIECSKSFEHKLKNKTFLNVNNSINSRNVKYHEHNMCLAIHLSAKCSESKNPEYLQIKIQNLCDKYSFPIESLGMCWSSFTFRWIQG
jgi:hypothetical protein